jgi:hypothetical protein
MFADATDRYVAVCSDLVEFQPEGRLTRAETEELIAGFEQLKAEAAHSAPHVVLDEMEQITDEARDVGEGYQRTAESMLARIDAQASDLGLIRRCMTIFASEMLRRLADEIDAHLIELVRALHRRDDEGFQELKAGISNLMDDFLEEAAKETGRSRYRQLRERSPRFAESGGGGGRLGDAKLGIDPHVPTSQ